MGDDMRCFIIPGLNGSGPEHWQSRWEAEYGYERVQQERWDTPNFPAWKGRMVAALHNSGSHNVLVAHSLGTMLVAKAMPDIARFVAALFMVAPPDPAILPALAPSFADPPFTSLGAPGVLVYSEDDEYCPPDRARELADAWALEAVDVGRRGHINALSDLGLWDEGHALLRRLVEGVKGGKGA